MPYLHPAHFLQQYIQHNEQHQTLCFTHDKRFLSLDTARLFNYNSDYLSRMLKKSVNQSYQQLLTSFRLQRAADELIHTSKPIYEIAQDSGFSNLNFFYKKFSESYGVSPSTFRENEFYEMSLNNASPVELSPVCNNSIDLKSAGFEKIIADVVDTPGVASISLNEKDKSNCPAFTLSPGFT